MTRVALPGNSPANPGTPFSITWEKCSAALQSRPPPLALFGTIRRYPGVETGIILLNGAEFILDMRLHGRMHWGFCSNGRDRFLWAIRRLPKHASDYADRGREGRVRNRVVQELVS